MNFFNKGDITKFGIPLVNCTVRELWERCRQQSNFTQRAADIEEYNRLENIVLPMGPKSNGFIF